MLLEMLVLMGALNTFCICYDILLIYPPRNIGELGGDSSEVSECRGGIRWVMILFGGEWVWLN